MSSDHTLALVNACRTGDLTTTLQQLTEALARAVQVPRVGVWQLTEQQRRLQCRHRYLGPGALPTPETVLSAEHCPRYFAALLNGALIVADDGHKDARCRELSAGYLAPFGIAALLVVPLRVADAIWGALWLEHTGPRPWTATEQQLAELAATLLSQQLTRDQLQQEHSRLLALSNLQQSILDGADYAIIATDTDGLILSFNAAATRMLGYRADELVGKQSPALFHDAAEVSQRASELSEQLAEPIAPGFEVFVSLSRRGQVEERQWTYIRKDGSRFPVLLSVTPMRRQDGGIGGFMGVAAELTEHQRMRASLRDSEARYQTLFDGTGDSIFLMRGEQFIDCNPATLKMFGCQRDQIVGQPPYRFSPEFQPDGRRSDEKAVEKITAAFSGQTQQFDWLHCQYDGTPFDAEVTLNVVMIAGEPHLLATVRDITARKRTEAELAQSRQTLLARNESLRLINQLSDHLHGSVELPAILTTTVYALRSLNPSPHVMLCLQEPEQNVLNLAASEGFASHSLPAGTMPVLASALTELVSDQQRWFVSTEVATDLDTPAAVRAGCDAAGIAAVVVVPLRYREKLLGSIALCYPQPRQFGAIEFDSFVAIGNTVAAAIASARHVDGLEYLAHHDSLTGLPNRMFLHKEFFIRVIAPRLSSAAMPHAALMLMDLDRFKEINDTLGHYVGDLLLQQIGPRLKSALADSHGLLCRLGGDEFALLLLAEPSQPHSVEQVRAFAQQLLTALRAPYEVNTMQLVVDASIGIAFYPDDGDDSHALLRSADVAMYEAKRKGIGIALYDRSQDQNSPERLAMIADLDRAIREQQLCLHFQPKLDLKTGHIAGFEALVRWQHPRLGLLYPDSFLALAEMSETIHPLTERVLDLALAQLRQWQDRGLRFSVAVNLSARNLIDDRILQLLRQQIARHGVNPALLELEITETALMDEPELAAERLDRIAALGVRIAIDDYGAGYSSLGYLHRLPIHALKIDRMFVRDMFSNEHDTIIVRSTIALAHNLGLQVVAEGVEDGQTQTLLLGMGCDHIQGYHLSRPLPADQLTPFLSR